MEPSSLKMSNCAARTFVLVPTDSLTFKYHPSLVVVTLIITIKTSHLFIVAHFKVEYISTMIIEIGLLSCSTVGAATKRFTLKDIYPFLHQ